MAVNDPLVMWTVYERPADYPTKYVARKFLITDTPVPTSEVLVCDTLSEVRKALALVMPGGVCMMRSPEDPAAVVETWL